MCTVMAAKSNQLFPATQDLDCQTLLTTKQGLNFQTLLIADQWTTGHCRSSDRRHSSQQANGQQATAAPLTEGTPHSRPMDIRPLLLL